MLPVEAEKILQKSGALLTGHFLLTSGRHSGQYMQCARILQYPEYAEVMAKALARNFREDKIDIVIGPAMGGIIVAYELARQLGAINMFAEREDGKMALRRFEGLEGKNIVVAEDVITTGGSVKEVIELAASLGGNVCGVGVLVDRSGGNIDFGCKLAKAYTTQIATFEESDCPLCREGKIELVKPGSRKKV